MDTRDIQGIAEKTHRQFVDLMYQDFGWKVKPDYSEVKTASMLSQGACAILPSRRFIIFINDLLSSEFNVKVTTAHESTHTLYRTGISWIHRLIRKGDIDEYERPNIPSQIYYLAEDICELGMLTFLSRVDVKSVQRAKEYIGTYSPVAIRLFNKDSGLIRRVSTLGYEHARKLILGEIGVDISEREDYPKA